MSIILNNIMYNSTYELALITAATRSMITKGI